MERHLSAFCKFLSKYLKFLRLPADSDPRGRRGRRYPWQRLFVTVLVAMLQCVSGARGIEEQAPSWGVVARRLGALRRVGRWAIGNFLQRLDPGVLREVLWSIVYQAWRSKSLQPDGLPFGVLAVDGKQDHRVLRLKCSPNVQWHRPDGAPPYGLHRCLRAALVSTSHPLVVDSRPVADVRNEVSSLQGFLEPLLARLGSLFELVTADAGLCSLGVASWLDAQGKGYLLALKRNQPTLEEEARRVFAEVTAQRPPAAMDPGWERSCRGERIRRKLWATSELAAWMDWTHLRQVFVVVKEQLHDDGHVEILEERLFITNMSRGRLTPERALRAVRRHWGIENHVFGTLDRKDLWAEDTTTAWAYTGNALANVALLRCIALALVVLFQHSHLRAEANRRASWRTVLNWLRYFFHATVAEVHPPGGLLSSHEVTPADI